MVKINMGVYTLSSKTIKLIKQWLEINQIKVMKPVQSPNLNPIENL